MKRMKRTEEGKPYLLKDALDPRAHNAHAKGPSNALELEGDGRGTDARKEEKARRKKRRKKHRELYKALWDWARVVSFVYIFMVATITLCNGLPPLLPLSGLVLLLFWLYVYPALKRSGVIRGGLW